MKAKIGSFLIPQWSGMRGLDACARTAALLLFLAILSGCREKPASENLVLHAGSVDIGFSFPRKFDDSIVRSQDLFWIYLLYPSFAPLSSDDVKESGRIAVLVSVSPLENEANTTTRKDVPGASAGHLRGIGDFQRSCNTFYIPKLMDSRSGTCSYKARDGNLVRIRETDRKIIVDRAADDLDIRYIYEKELRQAQESVDTAIVEFISKYRIPNSNDSDGAAIARK